MLVFFYVKSLQSVTNTVKKSTGGFRFDCYILGSHCEGSHIDPVIFDIIQFD